MTNAEISVDQKALTEALCHVLGNTCRIERTSKSYAWNANGPGSFLLAQMFRKQADEMNGATEPIAQLIIGLRGAPILDYSDAIVAVNPPTASDIPNLANMLANLRDANRHAGTSVKAAIDVAKEADEWSALVMLTRRLEAHRKHAHQLSQLVDEC